MALMYFSRGASSSPATTLNTPAALLLRTRADILTGLKTDAVTTAAVRSFLRTGTPA